MIIEIATLDDARLDVYARLTDTQLRSKLEPEKGIFIAESASVIERALEDDQEPLSLLMDPRRLGAMQSLIDRVSQRFPHVPIFVVPHEKLQLLTGFNLTRGALGAFRRPVLPDIAAVLANARRIVVLEDITNHTNVGAIFRSAAALGMDAVLVTPNCYDPLYRRAVRVSMGAVFQVPWTRIGAETCDKAVHGNAEHVGDWVKTGIPLLHEAGFKVAAMALSDESVPLDDARLAAEERLALVMGTEGTGLAANTIAHCDYTVRIPMAHGVDSLNVAAASAVAFWELRI